MHLLIFKFLLQKIEGAYSISMRVLKEIFVVKYFIFLYVLTLMVIVLILFLFIAVLLIFYQEILMILILLLINFFFFDRGLLAIVIIYTINYLMDIIRVVCCFIVLHEIDLM
jgi:hypothetical protein